MNAGGTDAAKGSKQSEAKGRGTKRPATKRSVTIGDVARAAGVAAGTVSNVLNDHPYVTPQTRQRVLHAIETLGYRKNTLARGLRTKRTMSLGLLLPTIANPFFPALARGVEDAARELGYIVLLCNTDRKVEIEKSFVKSLAERRVDGIVAVSPGNAAPSLVPPDLATAVVLVEGCRLDDAWCDAVSLDARSGIGEAADHLYELGHRRIGVLRGPEGLMRADERWQIWREAAAGCGIEIDESAAFIGDFSFESGYRGGLELLERSPRPTALVAANDLMALGAMKAAYSMGIHVPGELSIVGFDDIESASHVTPGLTTVRQPKYEMGAEAVRLLATRLNHEGEQPVRICMLKTELVVRQSTGPAPR